ncbi:MAG: pyridoxamine 5'-phosphate oxidase family protein [Thiohalocapsa sp.]
MASQPDDDPDIASTSGPAPVQDAAEDARDLWHGSYDGVLSTQSVAEPGYPFGSVIPLCLDQTARPLLLLSHLAQHSRNLAADPRCALTLFERPPGEIQQGRRLTCVADCHTCDDADALARYCRHFPNGRLYAAQLRFRLFRMEPRGFHFNGGFATARWLGKDRILIPDPLSSDLEVALLSGLRADRAGWLGSHQAERDDEPPEPVGLDRRGLTMRDGEQLLRFRAPDPIDSWEALANAVDNDRLRPRAPF